ncbi:MAG: anti-sigma factor family protein, partial [Acidobacteriota bacterium]
MIRELSNYVDQDVQPELRADIEAHLPTCAHCTAIYDGLRHTRTLMRD